MKIQSSESRLAGRVEIRTNASKNALRSDVDGGGGEGTRSGGALAREAEMAEMGASRAAVAEPRIERVVAMARAMALANVGVGAGVCHAGEAQVDAFGEAAVFDGASAEPSSSTAHRAATSQSAGSATHPRETRSSDHIQISARLVVMLVVLLGGPLLAMPSAQLDSRAIWKST